MLSERRHIIKIPRQLRDLRTSKYLIFFCKRTFGNWEAVTAISANIYQEKYHFLHVYKIISAVMLERNYWTFLLGLTTVLNNYRPTYVASQCTK